MLVPISKSSNSSYSSFLIHFYSKSFLTKVIHCLLYRADLNAITSDNTVYQNLKKLIISLKTDLKNDEFLELPKKHISISLNVIEKLIDVKSDQSFVTVSYDNVLEYYRISDSFTKDLFSEAIKSPVTSIVDLKDLIDDLMMNVRSYMQIQIIRSTIQKWDNFVTGDDNNLVENSSALNWIRTFKNTIDEAFTTISDTIGSSIVDRKTNRIDYTSMDDLEESLSDVFEVLKESYRSFLTSYSLIDNNTNGIESSNVTIISGDSNHGKSLFAVNVFRGMICEYVKTAPSDDDAFLIVTLEDDIVKLNRRIMSIFGNYTTQSIGALYQKYSVLRQSMYVDEDSIAKLKKLLVDVTREAIFENTTKSRVHLYIRHGDESTMSMMDIAKMVDSIQSNGKKVRAILIDYVDMMIPSSPAKAGLSDYDAHGEIIKEMRGFARKYGIAVVTITQNKRAGEGADYTLANNQIGDSYKKVRFADNIVMIRRRNDLPFIDSEVEKDINAKAVIQMNDPDVNALLQTCVVFEAKVTKVKNGNVDLRKYHVFNTANLKIYDTLKAALDDYKSYPTKSSSLRDFVELVELPSVDGMINYSEDSLF